MFFFMTTNKKQQCYPLCFFSWRPIKNDSVTPYVFFMTTNKKRQCYPLCFFSWRPIKNNSVTPYVLFDIYQHTNRWHHPDLNTGLLGFSWQLSLLPTEISILIKTEVIYDMIALRLKLKILCYPLCFFSWRPIKNNSVTPYVFFMTTNKKQQCYPLCFFSWRPIKNDSVTPYVLFDKYQQCYPFCFFLTRTIILFFSNMFFFMTTNRKQQCYPLCFFHDDQ